MAKEKFDRINLIQGTLARYGIKVYGYEKQSDNNELFFLSPIVLGGALPAQIKSQETQSAETVVSKTLTAIKNDSLRESQRGKWATLEYIDIRFNDQVSFKLK